MSKKDDLKKSKPKTKTKQKQRQKQKQNVVININSNNKRANKKDGPTSKASGGALNIPNVQPPQYITRGMPPTINNTPAPVPDMGKILATMAEMNSNYSGIGGLNSVIKGLNDKQSALESRLTQEYGLQNDFNNNQAHFNNQARNFFTANAYVAPPPSAPPMFVGGGVYQQPVLNPFNADDSTIGSDSNIFSFDGHLDDISEFTDNTVDENSLIENMFQKSQNKTNEQEEAPQFQFQPQPNLQPVIEKDPIEEQRIADLQQAQEQELQNQKRIQAREEAIKRKEDEKLLKEQQAETNRLEIEKRAEADVILNQKYDAQQAEINAEKQAQFETYAETSDRLMKTYGSYDAFLEDYTKFTESKNDDKKLSAPEKQIYNRLSLSNRAQNIGRAKALSNIQNNTNLNKFIALNKPHEKEPSSYVPLNERTGSLFDLPVDNNVKAGYADNLFV
jgi:hypothetical protein